MSDEQLALLLELYADRFDAAVDDLHAAFVKGEEEAKNGHWTDHFARYDTVSEPFHAVAPLEELIDDVRRDIARLRHEAADA